MAVARNRMMRKSARRNGPVYRYFLRRLYVTQKVSVVQIITGNTQTQETESRK